MRKIALKTAGVVVMVGLLTSCSSTSRGVGAVSAPLNDPWRPAQPMCKDPARTISVCTQRPGGPSERNCACMSVNEVSRAGLLPAQPHTPQQID